MNAGSGLAVSAVPEGFRPATVMGGPFIEINGPLYGRFRDGRLSLGMRIAAQHTNPLGYCHGGMLATFSDMLLAYTAMYQAAPEGRVFPTISLQLDYLAAVRLGAWLQGEADLLRNTNSVLFIQGLVSADGTPAIRVSGIMRQAPLLGDAANTDPLSLR